MSNYNGRIYPKHAFDKAIKEYKNNIIQLYCENCLQPWVKGVSNLDSVTWDISCPNCGSKVAPGVEKERMRELKIKRLIDE